MDRQARLAQIKNRTTRYEVALRDPQGNRWLVGYTIHTSKHGLLTTVRAVGQKVLTFANVGEADTVSFSGAQKALAMNLGNGWSAGFTGRTERDAVISGELTPVP